MSVLVHNLRAQCVIAGKSLWPELVVTLWKRPVRKQRETNAAAKLTLSFLCQETQPGDGATHVQGWFFTPQLNVSGNSRMDIPDLCLLGDSKSSRVDSED